MLHALQIDNRIYEICGRQHPSREGGRKDHRDGEEPTDASVGGGRGGGQGNDRRKTGDESRQTGVSIRSPRSELGNTTSK